jgi:D-sedoheptulose 7-phosphate isomerase
MKNLDTTYDTRPDVFWNNYVDYLTGVLKNINVDEIAQIVDCLTDARERGAQIFVIGNGGSASTASHFANDLAIGTRLQKTPLKVLSLVDNLSTITAVANDYSYEEIFSRQLKLFANKGDILIAITASGNSSNLVNAFNVAEELELTTIALTAFDGGQLKNMAQLGLHVPCANGDYGPAEDAHLIFNHFLHAYLIRTLDD